MNKRVAWFVVASLSLLGAVPGCSGSDLTPGGSAECSSFTACGGDLSGTWKLQAACFSGDENAALEDAFKVCDDAVVTLGAMSYSGTVSFDAGTEQSDVTVGVKATEIIPTSCLKGGSCADWQTAFSSQPALGTATCKAVAEGCSCAFDVNAPSKSTSPYTTSGTTFTDTSSDEGSPETSEYCVSGNQLKVKQKDGVSVLTR